MQSTIFILDQRNKKKKNLEETIMKCMYQNDHMFMRSYAYMCASVWQSNTHSTGKSGPKMTSIYLEEKEKRDQINQNPLFTVR